MISVEMAVSETDGSTGRDSRMLDDVSSSDFKAPLPIITSQGSSAPESSDQQKAVAPSESSGDADIASTRQVESSFHPPALKYDEPSWTATSTGDYFLEVVKNGTVVNNISLKDKSFFVVGRLPNQCDVCVEHPSCSRFHAVFQFGKNPENNLLLQDGCFLYDLNSTHGTTVNKTRITPETFVPLKVGYVIKFGESSRLYVVQGPSEEEEERSSMPVRNDTMTNSKTSAKEEDNGVDWGFGPDATEDEEEKNIGFLDSAPDKDISYYADDPQKALKAFFTREGVDMEYDVEEIGHGSKRQFHCRIPLPIDTPNGRQISAEATTNGKKKDALAQAILEACRLLHAQGILKGTTSIGKRHKAKNWADDDYYDSDEDTYLDRTGTVEKKRTERIRKSGKQNQSAETFDSLTKKLEDLKSEVDDISSKLQQADKNKVESIGGGSLDDLDTFMNAVKSGLIMDSKTRLKLKQRLTELKQEEHRFIKMLNIAKPLDLPPICPTIWPSTKAADVAPNRVKAPVLPTPSAPVYDHSKKRPFVPEVEEDETEVSSDAKSASVEVKPSEVSPISDTQPHPQPARQQEPSPSISESAYNASPGNSGLMLETNPHSKAEEAIVSRPYIQPSQPKRKKTSAKNQHVEYDSTDPDYAMWVPPQDQAGDGRTSLNERLGY